MSCGQPHATPCRDVLSWVSIYIDREIDEHRRLQVSAHLAECSPCEGDYFAAVIVKAQVLRAVTPEPAPAQLRAAIIAQIRESARPVE
jgi:mycothiol system anti-sigma-R factor